MESAELTMGARNPGANQRKITPVAGLSIAVTVLLTLCGCARSCDSRTHITLHDIPEDKSAAQASHTTALLVCPPGNPPGSDAFSAPAGQHNVTLSWNASTSSVTGKDIRYCLYRTAGGPVQKNSGTTGTSPCVNCQLVTPQPLTGTTYQDTHVENGAHYCYVAIAIDAGKSISSDFSNQADAVIPPKAEQPFCTPTNTKKTTTANHRGRR